MKCRLGTRQGRVDMVTLEDPVYGESTDRRIDGVKSLFST